MRLGGVLAALCVLLCCCTMVQRAAAAASCRNNLDCSLNGNCTAGSCVCSPAWTGPECATLNLQPTAPTGDLRLPNVSTWGMGSVHVGGKYHGFFAEMESHCGLTAWETNSLIAHAVADTPDGPWTRVGQTSGVWSHNPATAVAPDGTLLLFHIGSGSGGTARTGSRESSQQCRGGYSPCGTHPTHHCSGGSRSAGSGSMMASHHRGANSNGSGGGGKLDFFTAQKPEGPWTAYSAKVDQNIGGNNPAPWIHPNGSIFVVVNTNQMLRADKWQGPYTVVVHGACGKGEDGFLYTDKQGHFHCLYHRSGKGHFSETSVAGGHAYSLDGFTWHDDETPAYSTKVEYEQGGIKVYGKRERPHLLFSPETGEPTHLTTGVCLNSNYTLCNDNPAPGYFDYTFTSVQPINTKTDDTDRTETMQRRTGGRASSAVGYDNGMARKPPMGWQTWCSVGPCGEDHCTDWQIRQMADTLVAKDDTSGKSMKDLGYSWIVLDDCWHPHRAANGSLVPFPRFFPHGMKPVIDYVHGLGLTFGLYTSDGDVTCHGGWSPGSLGHWQQDADTFASWGVDYVKIDYCGNGTDPAGHHNMSIAMNRTGRDMVLALCRGPYQRESHWGYAPEVAQVWRATADHHDEFASTMEEVMSVKGKATWSGPHNWAYLDMMMTGGQGCADQCDGGRGDAAICNFSTPKHCPGQSDAEYRTEASLYSIVSTPMMIGTDIRLMTPIMKELLLNEESIAINQDYLAVPGDAMMGCSGPAPPPLPPPPSPPKPAACKVTLVHQLSNHACTLNTSFGCDPQDTGAMWVSNGCRGQFDCNGVSTNCGEKHSDPEGGNGQQTKCECNGGATPVPHTLGEVWVRQLSDGDLAVAMPNLGVAPQPISICLDSIGWKHRATAHARSIWNRTDLGQVFVAGKFTATVGAHDTLLLRLTPGK